MTVPIVKIVIGGHIVNQPWSFGIFCDAAGAQNASSADCVAAATLLSVPIAVWANLFKANWSTATKLESVAVYAYAAGSVTSHSNGSFSLASSVTGTGSSNIHPAYTSLVHTLLTGQSGGSNRGRCYVPITAAPLQAATSQFLVTDVNTFATNFAAMLTAITAVSAPIITNFIPVVASFTRGVTTAVNSVRVDTLPDTQHRREDKLAITGAGTHSV